MRKLLIFLAFVTCFSGFGHAFGSKALDNAIFKPLLSLLPEDCTLRLSFQIGKTYYWKNGAIKGVLPDTTPPMGTAPEIKKGKTFLIIRYITSEVGAKLEYWKKGTLQNKSKQDQVRITTKQGNVIDLWIGNPIAKVNGVPQAIDPTDSTGQVAPYIKGSGYTMLPLRFIGNNLGATINWISASTTAELIFIDEDCQKRCCDFSIEPNEEISLCPGQEKLVSLRVKNLCQTKKLDLSFKPGDGILSLDNSRLTVEPKETTLLKATLAMPVVMSEKAVFMLKVTADCGLEKDVPIIAAFRDQQCQNDCQWLCGCINKLTVSGDSMIVEFFEGCAKKNQSNFIDTGSSKDLILGLTFAQYIDKYGSGACAQICVDEDGDIQAWKAMPDRNPCCQDHVFATIDSIDCTVKIATGVDPEGTRWVFDLSGFEGCDVFEVGKSFDFTGNTVRPKGTAFSSSGLLEVLSVQAKDGQGEILEGKLTIVQCTTNPPMALVDSADGKSVEVQLMFQNMRNPDGRIIDCKQARDSECVRFVGYYSGEIFVACKGDILTCDSSLEILDCRIESVVLENNALLTVNAVIGCTDERKTYTSPKMLGDELQGFKNLLSYSITGNFARLLVSDSRIIRWKPRVSGCGNCQEEQLLDIVYASKVGTSGKTVAVARNQDGRLVTFEVKEASQADSSVVLSYKGSAKISFDETEKMIGIRKLSGSCCLSGQGRTVPSRKSLAFSSIATEILTGNASSLSKELDDVELQQLKVRLGTPLNPWDGFSQYGAGWIGPDQAIQGDKVVFEQTFCLQSCTDTRLKILCTSKTDVFLDDSKKSVGIADGIAHTSEIFQTITPGKHTLRFVQEKSAFSGLIFVMLGQKSGDCKPSSYQISFGTDKTLSPACALAKKRYALVLSNTSDAAKQFSITPVSVGLMVNPSSIMLAPESEELVQLTVQMPENIENLDKAEFTFLVQPAGMQSQTIDFSIPFGQCDSCSLTTENTLMILPAMCKDESTKILVKLSNACSKDLILSAKTNDSMLELPKQDIRIDADGTVSFEAVFRMPARKDYRFIFAGFDLVSEEKTVISYDIVAMYKNEPECCCDFEVSLQTNFIAEQTMEPGETFTYDYLVKNKCQGRNLNFAVSKGENILNVSPEKFMLGDSQSMPLQVKVMMPEKKAEYARFSFAVACDCGKVANIGFMVRYKPQEICCDYEVGLMQNLPQPFMLEPGTEYILSMGVKNKCKSVTLSASVLIGDHVKAVDPQKIVISPGQIAGFKLLLKMPQCTDGQTFVFTFTVAVDGCDSKTYEIPVACGSQMANCCEYDISDTEKMLDNLKLCPGQSKSIKLTLTNKCKDRTLSGTLTGGANVKVEPPSYSIEAGKSIFITITITMPQEAVIGSEYTFAFLVTVPGCTNRKYSIKVTCVSCGSDQDECCDFTLNMISRLPPCVVPGTSFELLFEICNQCPKELVISISGANLNGGAIAIGAKTCVRFKVTFFVPQNAKGSHQVKMHAIITSPANCQGKGKQFEATIQICN